MAKEEKIVVFNLAKEEYALPINNVREVLLMQKIRPLPQFPDFIEGMINIRGHIIVVVDMRKRFNIKGDLPAQAQRRIIICKIKKFIIGLIVDGVSKVVSVEAEKIQSTPGILSTQVGSNFISGVIRMNEKVILILNLENIFSTKEIESLSTIK